VHGRVRVQREAKVPATGRRPRPPRGSRGGAGERCRARRSPHR
jgi:hypothetical protein